MRLALGTKNTRIIFHYREKYTPDDTEFVDNTGGDFAVAPSPEPESESEEEDMHFGFAPVKRG